jgi:hypothetical protein
VHHCHSDGRVGFSFSLAWASLEGRQGESSIGKAAAAGESTLSGRYPIWSSPATIGQLRILGITGGGTRADHLALLSATQVGLGR